MAKSKNNYEMFDLPEDILNMSLGELKKKYGDNSIESNIVIRQYSILIKENDLLKKRIETAYNDAKRNVRLEIKNLEKKLKESEKNNKLLKDEINFLMNRNLFQRIKNNDN